MAVAGVVPYGGYHKMLLCTLTGLNIRETTSDTVEDRKIIEDLCGLTGLAIVDLLKLLDIDSSLEARKALATELNCPPELMQDSAKMNVWLHKMVIAKIADGEIGVMVDHYPVISTVDFWDVRISRGEERYVYATSDGFFKVADNLVQILGTNRP